LSFFSCVRSGSAGGYTDERCTSTEHSPRDFDHSSHSKLHLLPGNRAAMLSPIAVATIVRKKNIDRPLSRALDYGNHRLAANGCQHRRNKMSRLVSIFFGIPTADGRQIIWPF